MLKIGKSLFEDINRQATRLWWPDPGAPEGVPIHFGSGYKSGRDPTGLRARVLNQGRLENQSHAVPKKGLQDGGNQTRVFTHKIIILA